MPEALVGSARPRPAATAPTYAERLWPGRSAWVLLVRLRGMVGPSRSSRSTRAAGVVGVAVWSSARSSWWAWRRASRCAAVCCARARPHPGRPARRRGGARRGRDPGRARPRLDARAHLCRAAGSTPPSGSRCGTRRTRRRTGWCRPVGRRRSSPPCAPEAGRPGCWPADPQVSRVGLGARRVRQRTPSRRDDRPARRRAGCGGGPGNSSSR